MSAATDAQRWEIWGKYRGMREIRIATLEPYEQRDAELAQAITDYGEHWELWLEHFPIYHPHFDPHHRGRGRLPAHQEAVPTPEPQPLTVLPCPTLTA